MGEYKKDDKKGGYNSSKPFEKKTRKFDGRDDGHQNKRFKNDRHDRHEAKAPKKPAALTKQDRKDLRKKRRSQKKHAGKLLCFAMIGPVRCT